jgi:hypothetical protein
MNTGQVLLVVGALTLLSTLGLAINSSIVQAYVATYDSEATIDAISIGQAMIDEIVTQGFDSSTVISTTLTSPTQCTAVLRLGADIDSEKTLTVPDSEPFKSQARFNDIDDYHKYSRVVSSPRLGNFTVTDTVYYATGTSLDVASSSQTWYKRILVTVKHPRLYRPVTLSTLVVFRKFLP